MGAGSTCGPAALTGRCSRSRSASARCVSATMCSPWPPCATSPNGSSPRIGCTACCERSMPPTTRCSSSTPPPFGTRSSTRGGAVGRLHADELLTMTPLHLNPYTTEAEYRRACRRRCSPTSDHRSMRQTTMLRKDGSEVAVEKTFRSAPDGRDGSQSLDHRTRPRHHRPSGRRGRAAAEPAGACTTPSRCWPSPKTANGSPATCTTP